MKDKLLKDINFLLNEGAAKDLRWLERHVDGFNVRLTALAGMDAAYLFNKNHSKIQRIAKQLKVVTDELKRAVLDEIQDEKMRERGRR